MIVVKTKSGKNRRLLNPAERSKKFAFELSQGVGYTNFGEKKVGKNGKPKKLSDTQKSFRAGYLEARKDSSRAFKHNQKKHSS